MTNKKLRWMKSAKFLMSADHRFTIISTKERLRFSWRRRQDSKRCYFSSLSRHGVNDICERFHRTILNEFYQVAFRKKVYTTLDELQKDLDDWVNFYNHDRTHQGKMCCGRTPMQTFLDGKKICEEKVINSNLN